MFKLAVTTRKLKSQDQTLVDHAIALATTYGLTYRPRNNHSLTALRKNHHLQAVIVVEADRTCLVDDAGTTYWHPGMAKHRLTALKKGGTDPMLVAMDVQAGDRVLDCTLGLASDALVTAYAVGQDGKVIGLESQAALAILVKDAPRQTSAYSDDILSLIKSIDVVWTQAVDYLKACPDNAFDVVYLDPMFDQTFDQSFGIASFKPYANHSPLSLDLINQAKRVASKRVVIKANANINTLDSLGITQKISRKDANVVYGYMDLR